MLGQPSAPARHRTGSADRPSRSPLVAVLGGALCVATVALLWLGYRATTEWNRSEIQLADKRASEKLALLIAALDRDMKGAQLSVLVPINQEQLAGGGPAALSALFARAFARFPYPESFFVWSRPSPQHEYTYVFNRADRLPPWDTNGAAAARYPVVTRRDRTALHPFIEQIQRDATHRKRFAAYELVIAGVPYQVVVHLLYDDLTGAGRLFGLVGYTVNLPWVKREYFAELVRQVSQIGGEGDDMALTLTNSPGGVVTPLPPLSASTPARHFQRFPIRFFDRNLTQLLPTERQPEQWTAQVTPYKEGADLGLLSGQRMFALMGLAALASVISVVVIARGLTVTSELIAMKSEFVSTVTHELKTPLSVMRLVADTLVTGRYKGPEKIAEYGELLSAEVARMTHLIDNLLSFARLNRVDNFYAPAALDLAELLEEASLNFRSRMAQLGVTVAIDLGSEPITLHADRTALLLALDNLLDNAIKYSAESAVRAITLRGHLDGAVVIIEVEDHGSGIPAEDLPNVLERFYRGRLARGGGSGLGLAIVNQIVRDHGGQVSITSAVGLGTTVSVLLPAEGRLTGPA
jgi:signal transduction histidine kinase